MWCDWQTLRNCCVEDPSTVMNVILEAKVPFSWVLFPFLLFPELLCLSWLCRPLSTYQGSHFFLWLHNTFFFSFVCVKLTNIRRRIENNTVDTFVLSPLFSYARFPTLFTVGTECIPGSGIAGSWGMRVLTFSKMLQRCSSDPSSCPCSPTHSSCCSIFLATLALSSFSRFLPIRWYVIMVLIYISMITNDLDYLFMCLLDIWVLRRLFFTL